MNTWQRHNLKTIKHQLIWLYNKKDGLLFQQATGKGTSLAIMKQADTLALFFVIESDNPQKPQVSGVMSQINIKDPLYLQNVYQQAMLLSTLFVKDAQQVYMMGFGGGRIPLVLQHYYLPNLTIHGSETDSNVLKLAEMFFGIQQNPKMQIAVQDGREHLTQHKATYDIILIDCFADEGIQPTQLATKEFYQLCQARLSAQGVVSTNLVTTDPLFERKKNTFIHSFNYVYGLLHVSNYILFGSNSCDITSIEIQQSAVEMMQEKQIEMPLNTLAATIEKLAIEQDTKIELLSDSIDTNIPIAP